MSEHHVAIGNMMSDTVRSIFTAFDDRKQRADYFQAVFKKPDMKPPFDKQKGNKPKAHN